MAYNIWVELKPKSKNLRRYLREKSIAKTFSANTSSITMTMEMNQINGFATNAYAAAS